MENRLVAVALPNKSRLRFPKQDEKPPFKTWGEIIRLIKRAGLRNTRHATIGTASISIRTRLKVEGFFLSLARWLIGGHLGEMRSVINDCCCVPALTNAPLERLADGYEMRVGARRYWRTITWSI